MWWGLKSCSPCDVSTCRLPRTCVCVTAQALAGGSLSGVSDFLLQRASFLLTLRASSQPVAAGVLGNACRLMWARDVFPYRVSQRVAGEDVVIAVNEHNAFVVPAPTSSDPSLLSGAWRPTVDVTPFNTIAVTSAAVQVCVKE